MYNRVLTDTDRTELEPYMKQMQKTAPEMYSRKIAASMVQFAFCYHTALLLLHIEDATVPLVLSAGSHEDIATEALKPYTRVVGIDPVWNCDLHTYAVRTEQNSFDAVISASVLEHTENDEEFIADSCALLRPGGYGIFTMDFKDDWRRGQPVPYTSNRFYTSHDLTHRLPAILTQHGCRILGEQDYSGRDTFVWDGINYSFATFVFKKDK